MTPRTNRFALYALMVLGTMAISVIFLSCRNHASEPTDRVLTVSIEPLRYVVEAIAGDKYKVQTLMPQGASPETYEPTPHQMMELSRSTLVFRAGTLGFEQTSLPQMLQNAPDTELTDLAKGVRPIYDDSHHHGEGESMDPHTWMSTENLRIMARNACEALCHKDSVNRAYYEARLAEFDTHMDQLDEELSELLKPLQHRTFLIYHPALGYFARQYGLRQMAVEHDGKEPSASRFKNLVANCKAEDVEVVFISKEHVGRAAQRLADATGAHIIIINPLDYDVAAQMRFIAKSLVNTKTN